MKTIEDAVRELGGVWPFNPQYQTIYWDHNLGCSVAYSSPDTVKICTHYEFAECARRLRNEPSWDAAPDWAVAKAQDSDGNWWWWYSTQPKAYNYSWEDDKEEGEAQHAGKGEVIGDWKQTLKLRPEDK